MLTYIDFRLYDGPDLKDSSIDEMVGAGCFGCCQAHWGLDFFDSCIQFYLLFGPYLCFISFLYLDLYVL